jgi:thioredoxin reductase
MRSVPVAVYGKCRRGLEMARAMTAWTEDIVLCTDGASGFSAAEKSALRRNNIQLIEERVAGLAGKRGQLRAIVFRSGRTLPRTALFFDTPSRGQSRLAESLGCQFSRHGGIKCGKYEATSVPGVFVAGNIIKDVQLAIVAAAEGTRAAFGINRALTRENYEKEATGSKRVQHPPLEDKDMQRRRPTSA